MTKDELDKKMMATPEGVEVERTLAIYFAAATEDKEKTYSAYRKACQALDKTKEHEAWDKAREQDLVNNPKHYTSHPSGIEAIEVTRWMTYNLGNVVKYVWRSELKGNNVQDLEKAQFYLNDEIKRLKGNNA